MSKSHTLKEYNEYPLDVKYASFTGAGAGSNVIVAAVAGKKIKVLHYAVGTTNPSVTTAFAFQSAGNNITGVFGALATDKVYFECGCLEGLFATVAGEELQILNGGANTLEGHITYVEVDN